jgi:hypothetical protein
MTGFPAPQSYSFGGNLREIDARNLVRLHRAIDLHSEAYPTYDIFQSAFCAELKNLPIFSSDSAQAPRLAITH